MNTKRTLHVTLLCTALLLLGALYALWHLRRQTVGEALGTNAIAQSRQFEVATAEQRRQLTDMGVTQGMSKEEMLQKLANVNRVQQDLMANKWKQPISFYGKVVDANNAPVGQAAVNFIWSDTSASGTSKSSTTSDAGGLFSLTGVTGRGLSVYVEKTGYYYVKEDSLVNFDYAEGFVPDPNHPVIFRLRKKGPGVDLITSQHGVSPVLQISLSRDGNDAPIRVDFLNQKTGVNGQMEISQHKPSYGAWQTATNWSYQLAIPDGGFVETTDEFPFEAPASGYRPVVEFKFQKGDTNWVERINKTFYIAFGNPRLYGRIHIETGMTMGTILGYSINPDGSRNLESK